MREEMREILEAATDDFVAWGEFELALRMKWLRVEMWQSQ